MKILEYYEEYEEEIKSIVILLILLFLIIFSCHLFIKKYTPRIELDKKLNNSIVINKGKMKSVTFMKPNNKTITFSYYDFIYNELNIGDTIMNGEIRKNKSFKK